MIDQNLKIIAGDLPAGQYRIKAKKPNLVHLKLFGKKHSLTRCKVEKVNEGHASNMAKSLGVGVLFGGIFGLAHAAKKTITVEITLSNGKRILGQTSAGGYDLLQMRARGF